ncbi:MAG: four helix bundle protein [Patescibacteria group bacterium]
MQPFLGEIRPSYESLLIWQRSMDFSVRIYQITKKFPVEERYGLVSQMRRASVSVPSNIAEGRYRSTGKDFRKFLFHALGSAAELDTQICLATKCEILSKEYEKDLRGEIQEIMKMINAFTATLT